MSLRVRFDGVCKHFGPVQVLHGVSFELEPGRVYGLLGENGAGKSTLMKILCGYEQAGPGGFSIDGESCRFADSREAEAAGVVLIHQEFNLADDLSIPSVNIPRRDGVCRYAGRNDDQVDLIKEP